MGKRGTSPWEGKPGFAEQCELACKWICKNRVGTWGRGLGWTQVFLCQFAQSWIMVPCWMLEEVLRLQNFYKGGLGVGVQSGQQDGRVQSHWTDLGATHSLLLVHLLEGDVDSWFLIFNSLMWQQKSMSLNKSPTQFFRYLFPVWRSVWNFVNYSFLHVPLPSGCSCSFYAWCNQTFSSCTSLVLRLFQWAVKTSSWISKLR